MIAVLFALALAAGDPDPVVGGTAPAPVADLPTTVAPVVVTKPVKTCRKVTETGARNARTVCTTDPNAPPPISLDVRPYSPTMAPTADGHLNTAPKGP